MGRTLRRMAVLGIYGLYGGVVALVFGSGLHQTEMASFASLACAVAAWGGVFLFMRMPPYWTWSHNPDSQLDEREVAQRLRAYHTSYTVFSALVFVSLVAFSLALDFSAPISIDTEIVSATGWAVFLLIMSLPAAILAWTDAAPE